MLEKTNDPVRMYLREMGTVPLLTREGEVAIAKRIERGQLLVLKTITRSPMILKELLTSARTCATARGRSRKSSSSTTKSSPKRKSKTRPRTPQVIDKIAKLYLVALKQAAKLRAHSEVEEAPYLHGQYQLGAHARRNVAACARSISTRSKRSA
jgi:DNA-directed RNA polymerase sigma subunit (sigma70/sigma32)